MGDVLAGRGHHFFALCDQLRGNVQALSVGQKPVSQIQRRHQVGAVLLHLGDAGIVDVRAVLDGIHAGLRGPENALRAVRMRGDLASQAMGVGYDRLQFFQRVGRSLGIVAVRKHAAGGANLDQVGAVLDDLADFVLHAFHAVGHASRRVSGIQRAAGSRRSARR